MMTLILIGVLALVTVGMLGLAFAGGGDTMAAKRTKAIAERPTRSLEAQGRQRTDPETRRKQIVKSLKEQERRQRKATVSLTSRLNQAGLRLTAGKFWIGCAGATTLIAVLLMVIGQKPWIAAGVAVGLGLGLPRFAVSFLAKRRSAKFIAAFPDATDIIVRGIKSGLPVHECLRIISREAPAPLGPEFKALVDNIGMGMTVDQALDKMFERMPTSELRFFTIVLAIQQKTGGNLAEALGNLSAVLRARKLMREKVKAMASEAVASAVIIGSLPPAVMILISITSPAYLSLLFTDNRGHMLLAFSVLWMATGIFVMRRMINFQI